MGVHSVFSGSLAVVASAFMACHAACALDIHVSADAGSDENPGAAGAPFRTLGRAFRLHRTLLRSGAYPAAGVRIVLAPGRYEQSEGLVLDGEDRVPTGGRLVLDGGGRAVISGGVSLRRGDFRPVSDPRALARLRGAARAHVREYDLSGWCGGGWTAMADVETRWAGWGILVAEGRSLPVARWPNEGWGQVGKVVDRRSFEAGAEVPVERWAGVRDLRLHGFWHHDWCDEVIRVERISGRRVALSGDGGRHGLDGKVKTVRRLAALNVLEELDREGEWCLEPGSGRLYAWLPEAQGGGAVSYARLTEPLLRAQDCHHLVLRGLTFDCSRGDGVVLEGDDNVVEGCRFVHLGGTALSIRGRNNLVGGCDLTDIGGSGIRVEGGDRARLEPGRNVVTNCHVWQVGRFCRSYHGGIHVGGVEHAVRGNLIHDVPHSAIFYGGNNHVLERNEIFGTCLETGDGGALYSGRDWGSQGNLIAQNYIHHTGGVGGWSMGVYLDDCDSGDRIERNVFQNVARAVFIGGGRDNQVVNNVFVECSPAVHLDDRGVRRIAWNAGLGNSWDLEAKLKAMKYQAAPWSQAYPRLARIMADRPAEPLHNSIERNVVAGGSGFSMKGTLRELVSTRFNWYSDVVSEFGFQDVEGGDLSFRDMALVRSRVPGFREISLERIGLTAEWGRSELPDVRALLCRSLASRVSLGRIVQMREPLEPAAGAAGGPVAPVPGITEAADSLVLLEPGQREGDIRLDGVLERVEWAGSCRHELSGGMEGVTGRLLVQAVPSGLAFGVSCKGAVPGQVRGRSVEFRFRPRRNGGEIVCSGSWGGPLALSGVAGSFTVMSCWHSGVDGRSATLELIVPWGCLGGRPSTGLGIGFGFRLLGSGYSFGLGGGSRSYLVMP